MLLFCYIKYAYRIAIIYKIFPVKFVLFVLFVRTIIEPI